MVSSVMGMKLEVRGSGFFKSVVLYRYLFFVKVSVMEVFVV